MKPNIRRRFNQGLFKALYIGPGGEVERFEMTEPFATLLDSNLLADLVEERKTGRQPTTEAPSDVDQPEAEHRSRPATLLESSFTCRTETDKPDGGAVRLGLHKSTLVPPAGFEPAPPPPEGGALSPELRGLSDSRTVPGPRVTSVPGYLRRIRTPVAGRAGRSACGAGWSRRSAGRSSSGPRGR